MDKKRILVVDDEQEFLDMLKMRLEANNYEVSTATSAKEALKKIGESRPDAVLLDIMMPGMDGLTALKKIRKADKTLPVFIITAFSSEERFALANRFDASGFIVKTSDLAKEVANITGAIQLSGKYKAPKK